MNISAENLTYIVFMAVAIAGFFMKKRAVRWIVMLGSLAVLGFLQMGCPSPIGAIQNILMAPLDFVKTLPFWIKLAVVVVPAFFLGPIFCGWVCPKGIIQELLYRKELHLKIPEKLDNWLRKIPYLVLFALIAVPILFHAKVFTSAVSPFKVVFNLMGPPFALGFLIVILISSLFVFRPFCKYVCPVGALLSIVSRIGLFKIKPGENCTDCGLCASKCGMDALKISKKGEKPVLDKSRCIACGECRVNCSKDCLK
ncbi:4Fe-4S binding protein [bacterium]|nr:4Fe-4S binding protein [bacterium]